MTVVDSVDCQPASGPAVRGFLHRGAAAGARGIILAHGAGSNANAPLLVSACTFFAEAGFHALRINLPFRWLRPNGMLLLLAASWENVEMPGLVLAAKELQMTVSTMYSQDGVSRDIDNAALLLGNNPVIGEVIITHRFPLAAAAEAYAVAADRKSGAIKVLLQP